MEDKSRPVASITVVSFLYSLLDYVRSTVDSPNRVPSLFITLLETAINSIERMQYDMENMQSELQHLRSEYANLTVNNRDLKGKIAALDSDKYNKVFEAVTRRLASQVSDFSSGTRQSIVTYILTGQKINAIKDWRQVTGLGLKEAKDSVEAVAAECFL